MPVHIIYIQPALHDLTVTGTHKITSFSGSFSSVSHKYVCMLLYFLFIFPNLLKQLVCSAPQKYVKKTYSLHFFPSFIHPPAYY